MSFGALLDAAVAGTQRQTPPDLLPSADADSPEPRLLRAAAYFGLRRLAGRPLDRVADPLLPSECPPETLDEVPRAAAVRLMELIDEQPNLVVDWLRLAAAQQLRVPHAMLLQLLDYAAPRAEVHSLIRQVGGERIAWLAQLNPEWSFAARVDNDRR